MEWIRTTGFFVNPKTVESIGITRDDLYVVRGKKAGFKVKIKTISGNEYTYGVYEQKEDAEKAVRELYELLIDYVEV